MISADSRERFTGLAHRYAVDIDHAAEYLLKRGISREAASMFGLGYAPDGHYAGRMVIPYWTPAGVVSLKYRCMEEHKCDGHPKYLGESGQGVHLFNARALIHAGDAVVVTEGEMDAVCVQAYTGIPAVAYPGVDSFGKHPHFRHCFEGVQSVLIVADGDAVGRKAALKVAEIIGMAARVIELPDGEDSNSFMQRQGVAAFLERLGV